MAWQSALLTLFGLLIVFCVGVVIFEKRRQRFDRWISPAELGRHVCTAFDAPRRRPTL